MKKRKFIIPAITGTFLLSLLLFISYWINTQPVWIMSGVTADEHDLPKQNKAIITFVEARGNSLAPSYDDVVCTEFVIKVINTFDQLTKKEKSEIRIITNAALDELIATESPIIKGIQTALTQSNKGTEIKNFKDVRPGDFVQFWNKYQGSIFGHCGIVLEAKPEESLSVYSSHPFTGGYGKQKFLWPDKVFFVRMK